MKPRLREPKGCSARGKTEGAEITNISALILIFILASKSTPLDFMITTHCSK